MYWAIEVDVSPLQFLVSSGRRALFAAYLQRMSSLKYFFDSVV
jgi:hypothetical protein